MIDGLDVAILALCVGFLLGVIMESYKRRH